jgi:hypothetical protein
LPESVVVEGLALKQESYQRTNEEMRAMSLNYVAFAVVEAQAPV